MGTPDLILLERPWGLFGGGYRTLRAPESDGAGYEGRIAPLLFSRDEHRVEVDGDSRQAERFADIRTNAHEDQVVWSIPVPLNRDDGQTVRFHEWDAETRLMRGYRVGRPPLTGPDGSERQETETLLVRFLETIAARMHDFETMEPVADLWDRVIDLWLGKGERRDPTMDIIVRHAREYSRSWEDIARHSRRLLGRIRELVPLSRVEELDAHCMRWLSRQPGVTVAERAGGRQRILALTRHEDRNTLENRVFRDLLHRSAEAARDYLRANDDHTATPRTEAVRRYGRFCAGLDRELGARGVARLTGEVQANHVLLHDERYRHVWSAWQDIVRRERARDDLWRWQHRSWEEFCKAAAAASLRLIAGAERYFASPLAVRAEHRRGQCLIHDDPMVVVAHWDREWVVELLSGNSHDVPKALRELCASFWLRCAALGGGDPLYMPVWAVHAMDGEPKLGELVGSAAAATALARRQQSNLSDGIVLASRIDPESEMASETGERVTGYAFGPYDKHLSGALEALGDCLKDRVGRAVCER